MNKKEIGKKSRASGLRFEKKVREDLEKKGWICDRWTNNVELYDKKFTGTAEEFINKYGFELNNICDGGKLVPSKPKFVFNPKTKTRQMIGNSSGFPDFVCFKNWVDEDGDVNENIYEVIAVESKMNGVLDKLEKEKCVWLLDKIFSKILIASKSEKRGEIVYTEFK